MYCDRELQLSSDQDIGAGGGTAVSTNTVNLGAAKNLAKGKQLYIAFFITETFATSDSINFQVVTDTETALGSPTIQGETGVITIGNLTADREPILLPISNVLGTEEQYLGARYVEAGSSSSAGKITAYVVFDPI